MSSSWLATIGTWVTAASSGALAAWILNFVRERWNRPRLVIEVNETLGSIVETGTVGGQWVQKYARVLVRNRGRSLARNCCSCIDYVRRIDPKGAQYVFQSELIDLKWSLLGDTLRHVPAGGYRLLDVAHTQVSAADLQAGNHATTIFWIDGERLPERMTPELKTNAVYEMHFLVYGDNAAAVEFSCRVKVGNSVRELSIERCADPRPLAQR